VPEYDKRQRIAQFLARLRAAKAERTAAEAFQLVARVLTAVEDKHTEIPANPELWASDGRLYPPQADARRTVEGHPGVARFRSLAHNTLIAENGAIEIRAGANWQRGSILLRKPGADGNDVWGKPVVPDERLEEGS
jgi:hypothetical protein